MMVIWKIELLKLLGAVQVVEVPGGAEILCAREQFENICIWFRYNPANKFHTEKRNIFIATTGGGPAPDGGRYLGTALLRGGSIVLHVFELDSK